MTDDATINAPARSQRIEWLDSLRGVAMFLVVLGHCNGIFPATDTIIYSFHMPLFFMISGALFRLGKYAGLRACAVDKAKKILVPYCFFFALNIPLYLLLQVAAGKAITATPLDFLVGFVTGGEFGIISSTPLWFLPCFFFVSVLYWAIGELHERFGVSYWLCILVLILAATIFDGCDAVTILQIHTVPMAAAFFGIGQQFMINREKILAALGYKTHWRRYALAIVVLVAAGVTLALVNGRISMLGSSYRIVGLTMVHALSLSLAVTMIMIVVPKIWAIDFIGKNTMLIFAIHLFFIRLFEYLPVTSALALGWPVLLSVVVTALLIPISMLFNRYLPEVVGKKRLKA